MLYFITMKQMQDMPKPATDAPNAILSPTDGKIHFAVFYAAFPSRSKPFQYKVFCKHVSPTGLAIPNTPLYGLYGCDLGYLDESSVLKIAAVLHILVSKVSTKNDMWYEYESHSSPDGRFCVVRHWALLLKNYSRFINVNIGVLEKEFSKKYTHQFRVTEENIAPPLSLVQSDSIPAPSIAEVAVDKQKRGREEPEKVTCETPAGQDDFTSAEQGCARKKRRELHSLESELLNFNDSEPIGSGALEDAWAVPDNFWDGIELVEQF